MNHQIRFATPQDIDQIIFFIHAIAEYEKLEKKVVLKKESLFNYLFGERKFAEVLMLQQDEKDVGFALFFHNFSTFEGRPGLYLEDLFILPEYRGNGLGKATLKRLAQIARERDCARFEWVCLDWNTPSIEFYVKQGANPLKEWIIFRMDGQNLLQYK